MELNLSTDFGVLIAETVYTVGYFYGGLKFYDVYEIIDVWGLGGRVIVFSLESSGFFYGSTLISGPPPYIE